MDFNPPNKLPVDIISLLRSYVERNHRITNIEWDPAISLKLFFDPYSPSRETKQLASHYFLLTASISETKLIGRPENSRALLVHLNNLLWQDLFKEKNEHKLKIPIEGCEYYNSMGPERDSIPRVLASVNKFVEEQAEGDMISYASKFNEPQEMVNELSSKIARMSGSHIEKCWMYLNWLTRPKPDLQYFTNFNPRDLKLPLTSQIKAVGTCLGALTEDSEPLSETQRETIRNNLTSLGRALFPDDPTIVDYPFFMLGRGMAGKKPSLELLHTYLLFSDEIYRKTRSAPINYDIGSRTKSMFEKYIRGELEKKRIIFWYEPVIFRLPNGLTYRPDFLLPAYNVEGKKVVLEPHGIWEGRNGEEVAYKYSIFRKTYGNEYYLIIIVPSNDYQMVKDRYKGAYDNLIEGNRTPDLLFMLKTGGYTKSFTSNI